ncbi:isoprenylcysteine carboxylmethyltransferase family protein [Mesorhizobium sp. 1M-11]|uniref:methyltransferase family protein n=1 Tax=Mesorhizobium sp. 1M-11 TaxID=1529006 RepID=UPI0006C77109|nr:isoprenylcysteine carboxylmethyltransferase family protein [Mesorhizobium sp. 1M-11]
MTSQAKGQRTLVGYYLQLLLWMVFMAVVTFLAAGTLAYPAGWIMIVLFGGGGVALIAWLSRRSPQLLRERMSSPIQKGQEGWDKVWLSLFVLAFCLWFAFMPWDAARSNFTAVPLWLQVVGALLILANFVGCFWTFNVNSFAAPVVKIQEGQTVIDTGPYALVRHPMYSSALLLFFGMPLLLGSWAGLWGSLALSLALAWRSVNEEKALRRQFVDYDDYSRRVRYRLVPHVW